MSAVFVLSMHKFPRPITPQLLYFIFIMKILNILFMFIKFSEKFTLDCCVTEFEWAEENGCKVFFPNVRHILLFAKVLCSHFWKVLVSGFGYFRNIIVIWENHFVSIFIWQPEMKLNGGLKCYLLPACPIPQPPSLWILIKCRNIMNFSYILVIIK